MFTNQIQRQCLLFLAISSLLLLPVLFLVGFQINGHMGSVHDLIYPAIEIFLWILSCVLLFWCFIFKPFLVQFKQNQETLRFLQVSINTTPDLLWWVDLETGYFHAVNEAVCRESGYTEAEMLNMRVFEHVGSATQKTWSDGVEKVDAAGGGIFDINLRTKDNRIIPLEAQITHVSVNNKKYGFVILRNTRGQNKADEAAIQKITSQQEALLNNIPHIAWIKDEHCRYTAVNEAYARFCNRKREELIGLTDFDIWPQVIAEKFQAEELQMMETGQRIHFETFMQDPQGNSFWGEFFKTPINHDITSKILGGSVGIAQDVSDRKAAEEALKEAHEQLKQELHERKLLESQLIQAQKMESVGQLAAGVAHEINNPIGFVQSNLGTLSDYVQTFRLLLNKYQVLQNCQGDELSRLAPEIIANIRALEEESDVAFIYQDLDSLLSESKEGLNRIKEIVQGLKSFARPEEYCLQEANINECLESTLKIIWNELKYKCTVEKQFQKLPLLKCYPGQLNQVFMNLLINASQAIQEKGTITLRTAVEDDHIVVAVSDDGGGIHPDNLDSIFNPFFTTKPVGQGTGLGLSISYGIVQKHQGKIEVESELGKGSTFTVRLPLNTHINQEEQPLATVQPTVI